MKQTNLTPEEFDKRCREVFVANEGDEFYGIEVFDDHHIFLSMAEMDEVDGEPVLVGLTYQPAMADRPEALAYLLGERGDFHD